MCWISYFLAYMLQLQAAVHSASIHCCERLVGIDCLLCIRVVCGVSMHCTALRHKMYHMFRKVCCRLRKKEIVSCCR